MWMRMPPDGGREKLSPTPAAGHLKERGGAPRRRPTAVSNRHEKDVSEQKHSHAGAVGEGGRDVRISEMMVVHEARHPSRTRAATDAPL